jgi:hypothetical protein
MHSGNIVREGVGITQGGQGAAMDPADWQDHPMAGDARQSKSSGDNRILRIFIVMVDEKDGHRDGVRIKTIQAPSWNLVTHENQHYNGCQNYPKRITILTVHFGS